MKFSYRFSNLVGAVYRKGNLTFTPDGNNVISPVGNRITVFDLKNNKSSTLPAESSLNITALAVSPDGNLLIAVNEDGEAMLVSMRSRSVLHYYHFHRPVNAISFSPDGKKFAATKEKSVVVFHAPGRTKEFNPFVMYRTFYGAYDDTTSIDWSSDSRAFCVGGKDMNTRVYGAEKLKNLVIYSMGGHTDAIVNAFFEHQSLDLYTVSGNGQLCIWECDTDLDGLIPADNDDNNAPDKDEEEGEEGEPSKKRKRDAENAPTETDDKDKTGEKIIYKRLGKHNYSLARGEGSAPARLTSAAYHKPTHILCAGFSDGAFFLHEMPDFNLIHSLSVSDQAIASLAFNTTGEWLALGCSGLGQLLVWEWQSESYVMKQQGHAHNMTCLTYSPDSQHIATGGHDSKVKVWSTASGFCVVTFSEHSGGISGVTFTQSGHVVISSSLDGTVRAFDLNRYRNFRTFTSPRPVQFSCVAVDHSGEVVCAGGMDTFEIFVWSMQTGRLLEVLAGHSGPISGLSFSLSRAFLASSSWDKTVKLWDIFESRGAKETIQLNSDVLAVEFRPDGAELAVATLDANITLWDTDSATQTGSLEGRRDLGYSRKDTDKVTAKKASASKAFTTLCYTADGRCILAAGRSKNVCIYSVPDQMLVKKFEITCNLSFDGTEEFLDRRKMTEFGSLALVDEAEGERDDKVSLPGVKKGDLAARSWKPEVRVSAVHFSPTGREWAAATTEGLLVYSLDHGLVFDPFDLEMEVTPASVQRRLMEREYSGALMLACRLNEQALLQQVLETVPPNQVSHVCSSLPLVYVERVLTVLVGLLESSRHLHFYLSWAHTLLVRHGPQLKQRAPDVMATLRGLQRALTRGHAHLAKICDHNKYSIQYILTLAENKKKDKTDENNEMSEGGNVSDSDDSQDDILNQFERLDGEGELESNWE